MRWLTTRPINLEHAAVIWLVRRTIDPNAKIEIIEAGAGISTADSHVEVLGPNTKLKPFLNQYANLGNQVALRLRRDISRAKAIQGQGGNIANWSPALAMAVQELGRPNVEIIILERCFDQHFGGEVTQGVNGAWAQEIIRTMPIGTMLLDSAGSVMLSNKRLSEMLALSAQEIAGRDAETIPLRWVDRNGYDVMEFSKILNTAIKDRRPYEKLLTKSEKDLFLATSLQPVGSKRREDSRLLVTCVDVTDQILLEQTMVDQERRMHYLLNTMPFSVLEFGADGEVSYANASTHSMFKYSYGSLVGEPIWFTKTEKIDEGAVRDKFHQMIDEQIQPLPYVAKVVDKSGEPFDVRVDWNYRIESDDTIKGFTLTMSHLTSEGLRKAEFTNYIDSLNSRSK